MLAGIVMEYFDGQDLQAYIAKKGGNVQEDTARFIFQQMVLAVGAAWGHQRRECFQQKTKTRSSTEDSRPEGCNGQSKAGQGAAALGC